MAITCERCNEKKTSNYSSSHKLASLCVHCYEDSEFQCSEMMGGSTSEITIEEIDETPVKKTNEEKYIDSILERLSKDSNKKEI